MKSGNSVRNVLISLGAMMLWGQAYAYTCTGTIDWVMVEPDGVVSASSASSGLGAFDVCNVTTVDDGVSTDTCKSILAVLTAAHVAGSQVTWGFNDSLTCNRSPNWYWLNISPSVWYYGPQVQ